MEKAKYVKFFENLLKITLNNFPFWNKKYLNEALSKDPNNEDFLVQRSNIFVDMKMHKVEYFDFQKNIKLILKNSIEDLSNALEKRPKDPQILYKRGLSYYKNKEFQKCIKVKKKKN